MAVPDYQTVMLPLLKRVATAERPVAIKQLLPVLAQDMDLSDADLAERLPSGRLGLFHNRVHWAKLYMTRAGLLRSPRWGLFEITDQGRALLSAHPTRIDNGVLDRFPEFKAWRTHEAKPGGPAAVSAALDQVAATATPEERIDLARRELEAGLRAELLDRVRQMDPSDFEGLIIQLLVKMGYGQGRSELAEALGGSGDGGVDGVVNQDPLGLDRVYIQAKRNKEGNTVSPAEINSFIGALNIKRANKGLFVTASTFTRQAREHAGSSTLHVVLVDGDRLAELMVHYGVGVLVRDTIEVKAIDEGFFSD